jgi:hypothetical protein
MKNQKKQAGEREIQNGVEMVLKGHDSNGKEVWVTAEYYDKPKMNERKKHQLPPMLRKGKK